MSLLYLFNPSTLIGQLSQASLQVIIWIQIFKWLKSHVKKNYSKSSWYLQGTSKGDGEAEFLMLFSAVPQHTTSAIFVFLGTYFNSLQLFTMGTLGEFAFEFIELYDLFMALYVYNNCPFKPVMIKSLLFHHVPGVIVIIPMNLYYGDNAHVQQIAFSLLAVAPMLAGFFFLHKTRNVYDLQQRGQFTVYFFLSIVTMAFARFYWTPSLMIRFLFDGFMDLSLCMQIMFVFYGILINLFNVTFVLILGQRFYQWLYGNKCTNLDKYKESLIKEVFETKIMEPSTCPMLNRSRSSPLFFTDHFSKKRN